MSNSLGQFQDIISRRLAGVAFSYYTADEIRKLSVKEITNPIAFDALNRPLKGKLVRKLEKESSWKKKKMAYFFVKLDAIIHYFVCW